MKLSSRLRKAFQRRTAKTFGIGLKKLQKRDGSEIPKIVIRFCEHILKNGIDQEGLFRLSCNARTIRELARSIDEGVDVDLESNYVAVACVLLKKFLRNLPEPIVTTARQEELLRLHAIQDEETDSTDNIKQILDQFPSVNKATMNYLFDFLIKISKNAKENQMDIATIAKCFGPCLFQAESSGLEHQKEISALLETMLRQHYQMYYPQEDDPNNSSERRLVEIASAMKELSKELDEYKALVALKDKEIECERWWYQESVKRQNEKIDHYEQELADKEAIIETYRRPAKKRSLDVHPAQLMLARRLGDVDAERAISGLLRMPLCF